MTIVIERALGRETLWLIEELIKTLFGFENDECKWFRVKLGSLILRFLFPPKLLMFVIVQCVKKMEFMQLVGVLGIQAGRVLVFRNHKNDNFSLQNSLLRACECGNIISQILVQVYTT